MQPPELERYLHEHIPLSRAMAIDVRSVSLDQVVLRAPLAPNINHHDTVFGGSASAICILAAWSLVHVRLRVEAVASRLVIQRNVMEYLLPIEGDFSARATITDGAAWARFVQVLRRRGKGRIDIAAILDSNGRVAGRLAGTFVAMA
jgi:thioesterase domain-containing protein